MTSPETFLDQPGLSAAAGGPSAAAALGWTDALADHLAHATARQPGPLAVGRVVRVDRGALDVVLPDDVRGDADVRGDGTVPGRDLSSPDREALGLASAEPAVRGPYLGAVLRRAVVARGLLRAALEDPASTPCVGDWVTLRRLDSADPSATLEVTAVLPRRGAVVRASVTPGASFGQVLAAHLDVVLVVEGLHPEPDLGRIERFLALAWESGAAPVVVLTKADLVTDADDLVREVADAAVGAAVIAVSVLDGRGLDELQSCLAPGTSAALLGPSGAGKSTLVNALMGRDVMATRGLRADGKGRHTTAHRELVVLPWGAVLIDTPGLRAVGLADLDGGLSAVFSDVDALAARCRFSDCAHDSEPGCAVLAAVEDGDLPARRLDSWRRLRREAAWIARRSDARLAAQERSRWKQIHQEVRASGRIRP